MEGEYSHHAPIYVSIAGEAYARFLEDKFRTYAGSSSEERKRHGRGLRERYSPASGYPKEWRFVSNMRRTFLC